MHKITPCISLISTLKNQKTKDTLQPLTHILVWSAASPQQVLDFQKVIKILELLFSLTINS